MAAQRITFFVLLQIIAAYGSVIQVNTDFEYKRISVEVSDQVPRNLCQNTLSNLEVSNFVSEKVI